MTVTDLGCELFILLTKELKDRDFGITCAPRGYTKLLTYLWLLKSGCTLTNKVSCTINELKLQEIPPCDSREPTFECDVVITDISSTQTCDVVIAE